MTWTSLTFSVGAVLTAAQMNNLQNNFAAVANGDSGAPNIQTAGLANASVVRAKISTNTASTSGTLFSGGSDNVNIALNAYCFFPMIYTEDPGNMVVTGHNSNAASADSPRMGIALTGGGIDRDYAVYHRYITS